MSNIGLITPDMNSLGCTAVLRSLKEEGLDIKAVILVRIPLHHEAASIIGRYRLSIFRKLAAKIKEKMHLTPPG